MKNGCVHDTKSIGLAVGLLVSGFPAWANVMDHMDFTQRYAPGLPTKLVIDAHGVFRAYNVGLTDSKWFQKELDNVLKP